MMQSTVRVIIVSWNAKADLRACLASIAGSTAEMSRVEVVVVDNNSSDGSPEMVRTEYPNVQLRETGANLGFSGGNNVALADNHCDYVFLLNSDAMLPKGGLDTLLEWADATPDAGLIGPKVINPDETLQFSCRRWPTPQAGLFRNVYLGKLFPQNQPAADYLMRDFDHASPLDVDWLSGCAMLMRRACLEQVGPLDDKTFFMYCEDMDWSLRVHEAGWRVVYAPVIDVIHKIGGSSDQVAERMIVEHSRAMVRFWRKHKAFFASRTPAWATAMVLPWAILRASVRILKRIITGQAFSKRKAKSSD
ncbi:MAG: glycosyltransferase family 2 protein [Armatimonadota bacterium]